MNSDRHYRRDQEDKISSLNRVAADEEQGRLVLALARLDDLLEEFPNDASVLYEKGLLFRDCLGSGVEAYAPSQRPTTPLALEPSAWPRRLQCPYPRGH